MIALKSIKNSRNLKRNAIIASALILVGGYFVFTSCSKSTVNYMTTTAQIRDISKKVYATGTIEGSTMVDVGAQVSGQVIKLYVKTGDEVKAGDLLCEIDPKLLETSLKTAKASVDIIDAQIASKNAELKKLSLENSRQKRLVKMDATSKQDAEAALANYDMAKAALDELKAQKEKAQLSVDEAVTNLGYTKILAPMDGTVYATVVSEGQTVNANQTTPTILRLANLDTMKVETEISEADVVNVKPGMECTFTILGLPYRTFKGTLESIAPAPSSYESSSSSTSSSSSSSSSSSTAIYYNSNILTENKDRTLRIDMTADVVIDIADKKGALALPLSTLRSSREDVATVYVLEGADRVVEKTIKTGLKDDQYIEVISGLTSDDKVVIGDDVKTAEAAAAENGRRRRGPF